MKKLLFFCTVLIFSCQNKNDDLQKRLTTYFSEKLKDSTNALDELAIVKIDTLTKVELNSMKADLLFDEIINNDIKIDEFSEDSKTSQMRALLSETHSLAITADSLSKAVADSITPLFFKVKCFIKYKRKDLSVVKDTVKAFLSLDKEIVRKEDIK